MRQVRNFDRHAQMDGLPRLLLLHVGGGNLIDFERRQKVINDAAGPTFRQPCSTSQ